MFDNIWINGPVELLQHGLLHIQEDNDFDLRIAMISIDNSVELTIKTFLVLNKRILGINYNRYKNSIQKFPLMLNLLQEFIPDKISYEELDGIEMFHNLRNSLYHQGNGITIQLKIVNRYAAISKDLISRLFDVDIEDKVISKSSNDFFSLSGEFLLVWRKLELNLINISGLLESKMRSHISPRQAIDVLMKENKIDKEIYYNIRELNSFKNEFIHGVRDPSLEDLENRIKMLKHLNTKLVEEFNL